MALRSVALRNVVPRSLALRWVFLSVCALGVFFGNELGAHGDVSGSRTADLELRVVTEQVTLGTPFTIEILASYSSRKTLRWPVVLDLSPTLVELSRKSAALVEDGITRNRLEVQLVALDTGRLELASLAVELEDAEGSSVTIRSDAFSIEVHEVISSQGQAVRPLAAPFAVIVRQAYWRWKLAIGGVLLVFLAIWIVAGRSMGESQAVKPVAIVLSPEDEAYAAFDKLEASGEMSLEITLAYLRMSEILRRYLGRRFEIPALDLTSTEIRSRLSNVENSYQWLGALEDWLRTSDLVKFANLPVSAEEAGVSLQAARVLVDRSKEIENQRPREIASA